MYFYGICEASRFFKVAGFSIDRSKNGISISKSQRDKRVDELNNSNLTAKGCLWFANHVFRPNEPLGQIIDFISFRTYHSFNYEMPGTIS